MAFAAQLEDDVQLGTATSGPCVLRLTLERCNPSTKRLRSWQSLCALANAQLRHPLVHAQLGSFLVVNVARDDTDGRRASVDRIVTRASVAGRAVTRAGSAANSPERLRDGHFRETESRPHTPELRKCANSWTQELRVDRTRCPKSQGPSPSQAPREGEKRRVLERGSSCRASQQNRQQLEDVGIESTTA